MSKTNSQQREEQQFLSVWSEWTVKSCEARGLDPWSPEGTSWRAGNGDALELMRLARASQRWNERLCSVQMTPEEEARGEAREERRIAKAKRIVEAYGFVLVECGDPRGYALRVIFAPLDLKNSPYNTWGGAESGWGVPS